MLTDVYWDAMALLDGGWRPEDRDQLKEEFELSDDEADDICAEMENILTSRGGVYKWTEEDEADSRYREARENGDLDCIFG